MYLPIYSDLFLRTVGERKNNPFSNVLDTIEHNQLIESITDFVCYFGYLLYLVMN